MPSVAPSAFEPDYTLVNDLIGTISARIEHLLQRPVIARMVEPGQPSPDPVQDEDEDVVPQGEDDRSRDWLSDSSRTASHSAPARDRTLALLDAASAGLARRPGSPARSAWTENKDGTWTLAIALDYDDRWRGYERDVRQQVEGSIEGPVVLLTKEQQRLLVRSPREFLGLYPRPEEVELVGFETERVGGVERITKLTLADRPDGWRHLRHVAIVPNLVPLERQLAAARLLARPEPPADLIGLLALLGLASADALPADRPAVTILPLRGERLDDHQRACVAKALATPHFAAIQGPPGSGKTTFLAAILRREIARGARVLVVSPTNVAVDNVVEKLIPAPDDAADGLAAVSAPMRYAAKHSKVAPSAAPYWVGPKKQRRGATIARRLERRLRSVLPLADQLYRAIDPDASGSAPLTAALSDRPAVLCGTPIGLLSHPEVKNAEPAAFDLLIIDEVSKLTLPEFLAIAIKARRWVLVGDPQQLPPYVDVEESGATMQDLLPPPMEAVLSVAAMIDRLPPPKRLGLAVVIVARDPDLTRAVVGAHLDAVDLAGQITLEVCAPPEVDEAISWASGVSQLHRGAAPEHNGTVRLLVERGLRTVRPELASGVRLVEDRERAAATMFAIGDQVLHAKPWADRIGVKLASMGIRHILPKIVPSAAAVAAFELGGPAPFAIARAAATTRALTRRFAIGALSIYDWLDGLREATFDVPPLSGLADVLATNAALRARVMPYRGTLKIQYRMAPGISAVPRELFYFGEALLDGAPGDHGSRVRFLPVVPDPRTPARRATQNRPRNDAEANPAEADEIVRILRGLARSGGATGERILVITPYRAQERELAAAVAEAHAEGALGGILVEVCTLDRCQGREADHVFISLVRGRSTAFLDAPKRWNVALTRAMRSLWIVGDVDSYLREARDARRAHGVPRMSLLALALETYERHEAMTPARSR